MLIDEIKNEIIEKLKQIPFFTKIKNNFQNTFIKNIKFKKYKKESLIIDRGDNSTDVYFIIKGSVKVVNYSFNGQMTFFRKIEAGSYFGYLAALSNMPRSASVYAEEDSILAIINQTQFKETVFNNPKIAEEVIERIVTLVRENTNRIIYRNTLNAEQRVYVAIFEMATSSSKLINNFPKHTDLAAKLDVSRETISRALSKLADEKIIQKLNTHEIVVNEIGKLKTLIED